MWIRSQDKEILTKCSDLYIDETTKCWVIEGNIGILGEYSSQEKALKVMDMIEKEIRLDTCQTRVFQMPQDSEVE